MVSLQITQTKQLSELKNAIREDDLDREAQSFLDAHGGIENIRKHPEIVKMFAETQKLQMDDGVMEDLNANLSALLLENQKSIEDILKNNLSSAISDGFEKFAATLKAYSNEEEFVCVQCSEKYQESQNHAGACSFHASAQYDGSFSCCGQKAPCQHKRHRSDYHSDYPYQTYFERYREITRYSNTMETYVELESPSLEEDEQPEMAFIGKLLRFNHKSFLVQEDMLVVQVGRVSSEHTGNIFLILTKKDMVVRASNMTIDSEAGLITKGTPDCYSSLKWILNANGCIHGATLSTKASTSATPLTKAVYFDPDNFELQQVETVSEPQYSFKPSKPYQLPPDKRVGRLMTALPSREPREWKTNGPLRAKALVSLVSTPAFAANPQFASESQDNFKAKVSIFNKSPTTPLVILKLKVEYRLVGDDRYSKAISVKREPTGIIAVDPHRAVELDLEFAVPRSQEDCALKVKFWDKALVARDRPLRVKISIEDVDEETAFLVAEYIAPSPRLAQAEKDDIGFVFVDFPEQWQRVGVHFKATDEAVVECSQLGIRLSETDLDRIAYLAQKTGQTEHELTGRRLDYVVDARVWALVDFACKRVIGFRVLLVETGETPRRAALSYIACPDYGTGSQQRDPVLAKVVDVFPRTLQPEAEIAYLDDDEVDNAPLVSIGASQDVASASNQGAVSVELAGRL
ncbi:hypothetical protein HDU91_001039, partial [Kappamyces sp. JEL0680]